ncbi:MAG TPA: hypothetical protein VE965_08565, partial [Gammaproteobacteria bacterium]|nr:hypothetical protein [Gammaproteobacteria bacterium]
QLQVTDMVPACASCHSMIKADYTPEWPADRATGELPENKHYKAIESADKGYKLIPEDKRKALLEVVKWVDENSSLTLKAPTSAKPGQPIEVTVETKGGIGPVVGIFLVDLPLRFQARPIAADGWYVAGKPVVIGPDGKEQTWWLDKRGNEKKNLSFILVQAKADVEKKVVPTAKVTWTLRAPIDPGTYTITAAFLYGTEEPDEYKTGKLEPAPGGAQAPSGRTRFSDPVTVTVK